MSERLRIHLDRDDRTYRTGDRVSGRVFIETGRGDRCQSVTLKRYWKTHGKGNTARGGEHQVVLHAGPLQGIGPWEFPFEVDAPPGPFTHRGDYLNVDHYVRVDLDIPWAFDPKAEEEFILLPGPATPEPDPGLLHRREAKKQGAAGCRRVMGILFMIVGVATLPLGVVFMGVGLLLIVPDLRRKLAGLKVGEVTVRVGRRRLTPGAGTDVDVQVVPSKEARLNEATVVLRGREVCVSGSGTDRTTHTNTLHEVKLPLSGPKVLLPGQTARLHGHVQLPDDAAWSFVAKDNEITWDAVVRLDIPSWPDWIEEVPLLVWPGVGELPAPEERLSAAEEGFPAPDERIAAGEGTAGLSALEAVGEALRDVETESQPTSPDALEPAEEPDVELPGERPETPAVTGDDGPPRVAEEAPEPVEMAPEPAEEPAVEGPETAGPAQETELEAAPSEPPPPLPGSPDRAPDAAATTGAAPIVGMVRAILGEPSFGGRRKELEAELVGSHQAFEVDVDRVERSFGVWDAPEYRDGSTLVGTVAGSELKALVRFPPWVNEAVQALERGERCTVRGTVAEWERLREQVVLHAEEAPGAPD
ncbi:MAG: hypothetical protein PVI57_00960 [Gemmatimonadota bacterium]